VGGRGRYNGSVAEAAVVATFARTSLGGAAKERRRNHVRKNVSAGGSKERSRRRGDVSSP
jgi:hypothetical protein